MLVAPQSHGFLPRFFATRPIKTPKNKKAKMIGSSPIMNIK